MCRCTTGPNIVDTFGYIPGQVKFSVEPALVRSWHWNSKVPSSWIYRPRGFGEYMGSVPPRTRGCRPLEFAQVPWIAFVRASLTTGLMMLNVALAHAQKTRRRPRLTSMRMVINIEVKNGAQPAKVGALFVRENTCPCRKLRMEDD